MRMDGAKNIMSSKKRNRRDVLLWLFTGYGRLSEYNRNIFAKNNMDKRSLMEVSGEISDVDSLYPTTRVENEKKDE